VKPSPVPVQVSALGVVGFHSFKSSMSVVASVSRSRVELASSLLTDKV